MYPNFKEHFFNQRNNEEQLRPQGVNIIISPLLIKNL